MSSPRHARSASTQQSELHRTVHRHPSGDGSAARRCRPMLDEMRASQAESPLLACCPSLFLGIPAHALAVVDGLVSGVVAGCALLHAAKASPANTAVTTTMQE